jgi:hypothetical protein
VLPKTQRERQREYYNRHKQKILEGRKKERERNAEARKKDMERKAEARKIERERQARMKCIKTSKINAKPIEKERFTVHLY